MANIVVMPEEQIDDLFQGSGAVVFVSRELMERIGLTEDDLWAKGNDYEFGGEADVLVDLVTSEDHYFLTRDDDLDGEQ